MDIGSEVVELVRGTGGGGTMGGMTRGSEAGTSWGLNGACQVMLSYEGLILVWR